MASQGGEMVYNGEVDGFHVFEIVEYAEPGNTNMDEGMDPVLGWYKRTGKFVKLGMPDCGFDKDRIYEMNIR